MKYAILTMSVLTVLGACGGAGTPPTTNPPPATTRSASATVENFTDVGAGGTLTVDYSQATDTFTFATSERGALNIAANPNYDVDDIAGFRSTTGARWGYAVRNGDGQAVVVATNGDSPTEGIGAMQIERLATATAPISGASTFNGDYAGFIRSDSNGNNIAYHVSGDVSIGVDFADNRVDGTISEREFRNLGRQSGQSASGTLRDVTLNATTLNGQLAFDGSTAGGRMNLSGASVDTGDYAGLVAGSSAESVVGGVVIEHERDFGFITLEYTETGIFSASD